MNKFLTSDHSISDCKLKSISMSTMFLKKMNLGYTLLKRSISTSIEKHWFKSNPCQDLGTKF